MNNNSIPKTLQISAATWNKGTNLLWFWTPKRLPNSLVTVQKTPKVARKDFRRFQDKSHWLPRLQKHTKLLARNCCDGDNGKFQRRAHSCQLIIHLHSSNFTVPLWNLRKSAIYTAQSPVIYTSPRLTIMIFISPFSVLSLFSKLHIRTIIFHTHLI